jgi:hypothetical protein
VSTLGDALREWADAGMPRPMHDGGKMAREFAAQADALERRHELDMQGLRHEYETREEEWRREVARRPRVTREQVQAVVDRCFDAHEENSSVCHDELIVDGIMKLIEGKAP